MGPLAGSTTRPPPSPGSLPRTHSRSTCSGPTDTVTRTAELGEPRRLSVRGGAVPGRTLGPEGPPSSARQEVREPASDPFPFHLLRTRWHCCEELRNWA